MNEKKDLVKVGQELSIEATMQKYETRLKLVSMFKEKALKFLKKEDVVDQGGKPYILESGSIGVIAKGFEMSIKDREGPFQTVIKHDGEPDEIIFSYTGNASSPGLGEIMVQGVCSSRDKFLGLANGVFKKHSELNFPSLMQKALTNLRNNAVRHYLGLSNLTWDEVEKEASFKRGDCTKVDYYGKQKQDLSEDAKKKLNEIRTMAKEIFQGDKAAASKYFKEITTFTLTKGKDKGKEIPGKSDPSTWSETQILKIVYPKVKSKFTELKGSEGEAPKTEFMDASKSAEKGMFKDGK